MNYQEYRKQITNNNKRNHFIKNSYSINQIYSKSEKDDDIRLVDRNKVLKIIRLVNKKLTNVLIKEGKVKIPQLGTFTIISWKPRIYIKDNKIHTNKPIDWEKTFKLWYEDEECAKKKIKIYRNLTEIYDVDWDRNIFVNHNYFKFAVSKPLRKKIKEYSLENDIITYEKQQVYNNKGALKRLNDARYAR